MTERLIASHLAYLRTVGRSEETLRQRDAQIRRFREWLLEHTDAHLVNHASRVDVHDWLSSLVSHTTSTTRGLYLSHVSGFFEWLIDQGLAAENPARGIKIRRPRRYPRPVPEDDAAIIQGYGIEPEATWLLVAASAGLRAGEISRIEADHLTSHGAGDERRWWLYIRGKGDKERVIPIGQHVAKALVPWRSRVGTGRLFLRESGRPVSADDVSRRCNHVLQTELGLPYRLHQLRHSYGTELYAATRDLRLVQDMLGHSSPQTTALYTQAALERGRDAVEQIGTRRHLRSVG